MTMTVGDRTKSPRMAMTRAACPREHREREVDLLAATALGLAVADGADAAPLLQRLADQDPQTLTAAEERVLTLTVTDPITRQSAVALLASARRQLSARVEV